MFETPVTPSASSEDLLEARQKFEREKLTRRAALKKFGITTGMSVFCMFGADDLARIVIKKMEEHEQTRQIAETVAHEFKNAGIAFADSSSDPCSNSTSTVNCEGCNDSHYQTCLSKKSAAVCYNRSVACEAHCDNSTGDAATLASCWGDLGK